MSALHDLGRRAVACKGWRWLPGMATLPDQHGRVWRAHAAASGVDGAVLWVQERGRRIRTPIPLRASLVPDLSDAATIGCLLALVREAYGPRLVWVEPVAVLAGDGSYTYYEVRGLCPTTHEVIAKGSTEAEALVLALEAASRKKAP